MLTLADVVEALAGVRPERASQVLTEAVIDLQQVIPGSLFISLPGQQRDESTLISQAFDRGAILALVQNDFSSSFLILDTQQEARLEALTNQDLPLCLQVKDTLQALHQLARFWRARISLGVIGITGSVGKTTTKEMVVEVLSRRYRTLTNSAKKDNEFDSPLTLLSFTHGHHRAVLEFDPLGRMDFIKDVLSPSIGVITNVGTMYASKTGTQRRLADRVAVLVRALPENGFAILNYDDLLVRPMAAETSATVFYYGLDPQADLWADEVEGLGLDGIRFRLHYGSEEVELRVPMIGRHSVHTALRASAVGIVERLGLQEIVEGLRFGQTQLRLVAVRSLSGALVLDDTYNASPMSTLAALNLLDELEGRKIAVLGGMPELGAYEQQGHEMVGLRAAQVADLIVTVGDLGNKIASAARTAWFPSSAIREFVSVKEVIQFLRKILNADDIVLIKGPRRLKMDRIAASLERGK